nr:hypothetical protein [Tanacetum cinerariifolium]
HVLNKHELKRSSTSGIRACKEALIKKNQILIHKIFLLFKMVSDAAHMIATLKVPMLKPGEFELWKMRIEQYILMMDYAL